MSFGKMFSALFSAQLSFGDIGVALSEVYRAVSASDGIAPVVESVGSLFGGEIFMAVLLFVLSFFVCIFGARVFPLFRFLCFFALGYVVGACYLAPPVAAVVHSVSPIFVGICIAIPTAALSRALWELAYPSAFAVICYVLVGNSLGWGIAPAIIASVAAALIALVMRRYAEIVITSVVGAWGICETVRMFWDFAAVFEDPLLATLSATLTIGLFGALMQFRGRDRSL